MLVRISARSSFLARFQALQVGEALQRAWSDIEISYSFRESLGDKNLTDPLWKMPEKGVFTEDFVDDLKEERTDLVVHSWKDLPTDRGSQTEIVATLPRADQRDLLLVKKTSRERMQNQKHIHLFSSSLRRQKNLEEFLSVALPSGSQPGPPHKVQFHNVRGNIPTRINKLLQTEQIDGLVLAKAALDRLLAAPWPDFQELRAELRQALEQCDWMVLPLSENPNAAAQGALAIEVKKGRPEILERLAKINDQATFGAVERERNILAGFGGGCHQKIGIAVLPRAYGEVQFLRGITDGGEVLDSARLIKSSTSNNFLKQKKWSSSSLRDLIERKEIPFEIPASVNALVVSRISAWRPFSGYVWAAGIETWKQLAARGVWVHGCTESLGEAEDAQIQILANQKLVWGKLTHQDAPVHSPISLAGQGSAESGPLPICTYSMSFSGVLPQEVQEELLQAESLFWTSSFHFDLVTRLHPEVLVKTHCCGPGNTWRTLQQRLVQNGLRDKSGPRSPQVFLNEKEWRES